MPSYSEYEREAIFDTGIKEHLLPENLKIIAALKGTAILQPDRIRVLELCCGTARTACAIAALHPESEVVALDFNKNHIDIAERQKAEKKLLNLTLLHADLLDHASSISGDFDYIYIHGSFSWIGDDAHNAVYQIIDSNLKEGGVFAVHHLSGHLASATTEFWKEFNSLFPQHDTDSALQSQEKLEFLGRIAASKSPILDHIHVKKLIKQYSKPSANTRERFKHAPSSLSAKPISRRDLAEKLRSVGLERVGATKPELDVGDIALPTKFELATDAENRADIFEFLSGTSSVCDFYVKTTQDDMPICDYSKISFCLKSSLIETLSVNTPLRKLSLVGPEYDLALTAAKDVWCSVKDYIEALGIGKRQALKALRLVYASKQCVFSTNVAELGYFEIGGTLRLSEENQLELKNKIDLGLKADFASSYIKSQFFACPYFEAQLIQAMLDGGSEDQLQALSDEIDAKIGDNNRPPVRTRLNKRLALLKRFDAL